MRNPNKKLPLTRRAFMAKSACAGAGLTGIVNTLAHLKLMQGALANNISGLTGYKALIVLFSNGGSDCNQMLMPGATHPSRGNYDTHRGVLALPTGGTHPTLPVIAGNLAVAPNAPAGAEHFALHPSMPDLRDMFNAGDLCFAANVGTAVVPTTKATYNTVALPPQLYSHSDQQTQWQSSIPDKPFQSGWCGRIADFINAQNVDSQVSMSISLAGVNDIQVGLTPTAPQYAVTTTGAVSLEGYGTNYSAALSSSGDPESYTSNYHGRRLKAFQDVMNYTHDHLFEESYNGVVRRARENEGYVGGSVAHANAWLHPSAVDQNGVPWPFIEGTFLLQNGIDPTTLNSANPNQLNALPYLSRQLLMIAKLITGRSCLGNKRQIFFCTYYGHDTHSDQGGFGTDVNGNPNVYVEGAIDNLMDELNDGLKAFNDCMHELETREAGQGLPAGEEFTYNDFILASHSDFNRTFTPNGTIAGPSGSDHAWATHCFAMGGDVKGGNVYGYYPDLDPVGDWGAPISTRGLWIPTASVEQFAAPLAKWLGVTTGEIDTIFPNLERFADPFTVGYDPLDYSTMLANAHMDYIDGIL